MIKLLPHHRLHIPNSLAMFAALVLIVSSVVGFEENQTSAINTGQENSPVIQTNTAETDSVSNSVEKKSRSFSIGSLLFRRG